MNGSSVAAGVARSAPGGAETAGSRSAALPGRDRRGERVDLGGGEPSLMSGVRVSLDCYLMKY